MEASKILPNEVWVQILGYLNKSELKALRLSGDGHLSLLAASKLFTTAYIAARRGVLDTFTILTTHHIYRHFVEEIVFDSSYFDPQLVAEYAKGRCGPPLAALFKEQEHIQVDELADRLENALCCIPRLKKIRYADLSRMSCLPGDQNDPLWGCDYLDGPLIRRLESHESRTDCGHHWQPDFQCCSDGAENYRREHGGLFLLLRSLMKVASSTMTELSLGDGLHSAGDGGISYWDFELNSYYENMESFDLVFRSLKKLDISISIFPLDSYFQSPSDVWEDGGDTLGESLQKTLALADNLEELRLIGGPGIGFLDLAATLGQHTWKRLRVLDLGNVEANDKGFENFLTRHASSLQCLILDRFNLTGRGWESIGENMRTTAPGLEIIWGLVFVNGRRIKAYSLLPFNLAYLDISSPQKRIAMENLAQNDIWNYEGERSDENSDSRSDGSSSDTEDELQEIRESDLALLNQMDLDLLAKVERLRDDLPGCPVQACVKALIAKQGNREIAKVRLTGDYEYPGLVDLSTEMQTKVSRVLGMHPGALWADCTGALKYHDGNVNRASHYLSELWSSSVVSNR